MDGLESYSCKHSMFGYAEGPLDSVVAVSPPSSREASAIKKVRHGAHQPVHPPMGESPATTSMRPYIDCAHTTTLGTLGVGFINHDISLADLIYFQDSSSQSSGGANLLLVGVMMSGTIKAFFDTIISLLARYSRFCICNVSICKLISGRFRFFERTMVFRSHL